jgi:cyclopropane-fatty-acyl-phospholipid synthase
MTVAERLATLVRDVVGIELPVRIRAWDGTEAGPADGPVLVIRSRRALRRLLWAPGEMGLARAYVMGDIDVEGDLADGFRRAWRAARSRPSAPRLTAGGSEPALQLCPLLCRAVPADAKGDEQAYLETVTRYRDLAERLDARGHIADARRLARR